MGEGDFQVVWRNNLLEKDDPGYESRHGIYDTIDECYQSIKEWWKQNEFYPPYTRWWENPQGEITLDYGSHYFFYHIVKLRECEWR